MAGGREAPPPSPSPPAAFPAAATAIRTPPYSSRSESGPPSRPRPCWARWPAGGALSSLPAVSENLPSIYGLNVVQWASFVLVIFASSFIGSFVDGGLSAATNQVLDPDVVPGDPDWYANLNRPRWEPPGWVFPIMWLIVSKPTQLVAVGRMFGAGSGAVSGGPNWAALAVYCSHLSLGDAWNKVFFGFQCPGRGAAIITAFFGLLLTSAGLFWNVDEVAGRFMLPTCAWVSVATALNWSNYLRN